jgi:hypothetical protein
MKNFIIAMTFALIGGAGYVLADAPCFPEDTPYIFDAVVYTVEGSTEELETGVYPSLSNCSLKAGIYLAQMEQLIDLTLYQAWQGSEAGGYGAAVTDEYNNVLLLTCVPVTDTTT